MMVSGALVRATADPSAAAIRDARQRPGDISEAR